MDRPAQPVSRTLVIVIASALTVLALAHEFWRQLHPALAVCYLLLLALLLGLSIWNYRRREPANDQAAKHTAAHLLLLAVFACFALGMLRFIETIAKGHVKWGVPALIPANLDWIRHAVGFVLALAAFAFILWLANKITDGHADFHLRRRWSWWDALIILGLGSSSWLGVWMITWAQVDPYGPPPPMPLPDLSGLTWNIALLAAATALGVALIEELWFRGILLGVLRPLVGGWQAVVLQGIAFGITHWFGRPAGIYGVLAAAGWGMLLGWWVLARRSIWPAVAVHFLTGLVIAAMGG